MKTLLESLDALLEELREDERPKLVEGEKDRKALARFGIRNIVLIQLASLPDVAARVGTEAILLTDYDRRGELMAQRLAELLRNEGVRTDLAYRKRLRQLTGIRQIEEIVRKYEEIREGESYGKSLHRHGKIRRACELGDRRRG